MQGVTIWENNTKLHLELSREVIAPYRLFIYCIILGSVEDLVGTEAEMFDAVVSSEVIEHVSDVKTFVESCCKLVKVKSSI